MAYPQELKITLNIEYDIINGEISITKDEKIYIMDKIIEELITTEEFINNLFDASKVEKIEGAK